MNIGLGLLFPFIYVTAALSIPILSSICYDSGRFLPGVPPSISLAQLTPDKNDCSYQ